MITAATTNLEGLLTNMKAVSGGMPQGKNLLEGIDADKASLPQIMAIYKSQKTSQALNADFEESLKKVNEAVGQDSYSLTRRRAFVSS